MRDTGNGWWRKWYGSQALECWFALAFTFSLPYNVHGFTLFAMFSLEFAFALTLECRLTLTFSLELSAGASVCGRGGICFIVHVCQVAP